jgi:hypothetical protein
VGDRVKIISTDGEEGFYAYEVDGKFLDKTVEENIFHENVVMEWKKLIPITKKKLLVNVKR